MNQNPTVEPVTSVPSPEYSPATYPNEPDFFDLSDAIEHGEPGYRDPDTLMLSGILMKIDRLLTLAYCGQGVSA